MLAIKIYKKVKIIVDKKVKQVHNGTNKQTEGEHIMKTLFTEFQSRGSLAADRLIYTSGLYCLVTSGDDHSGSWDGSAASAVECGITHGFCTADKELAFRLWEAYTENHFSRKG